MQKIRRVFQDSYKKILDDLSTLKFKKQSASDVDKMNFEKHSAYNSRMFLESIKVLISPTDKGFEMAILDQGTNNFKEEEKKLCRNIARGMVEHARKNPKELYTKGENELKKEAIKEEINRNELKEKKIIKFPKK